MVDIEKLLAAAKEILKIEGEIERLRHRKEGLERELRAHVTTRKPTPRSVGLTKQMRQTVAFVEGLGEPATAVAYARALSEKLGRDVPLKTARQRLWAALRKGLVGKRGIGKFVPLSPKAAAETVAEKRRPSTPVQLSPGMRRTVEFVESRKGRTSPKAYAKAENLKYTTARERLRKAHVTGLIAKVGAGKYAPLPKAAAETVAEKRRPLSLMQLSSGMRRTVEFVACYNGPVTAKAYAEADNLKYTTARQRLSRAHAVGLIDKAGAGKFVLTK